MADQFSSGGPVITLIETEDGREAVYKVLDIPRGTLMGGNLPVVIKKEAYYQLKGFEANYEGKDLGSIVEKFEKFKVVFAEVIID